MKLILLIFLLTFLSCEKKSSNYNMSNVEFAEEMQTYYFENENMVFSLNAKRMQKETQNINLNISHNFFCIDEDYFYTDSIYKILDSIFLKLNEQTFSEIINFSARGSSKLKLRFFFPIIFVLAETEVSAELSIQITQGVDNPIPIAVVPFSMDSGIVLSEDVAGIVRNDLEQVGEFRALSLSNMISLPDEEQEVFYRDWRILAQDYLLVGKILLLYEKF